MSDQPALHPLLVYRRKTRETLRQTAARFDIGPSTLLRIEKGALNPSFELMQRIVAATAGEVTGDILLAWQRPKAAVAVKAPRQHRVKTQPPEPPPEPEPPPPPPKARRSRRKADGAAATI